MKLYYHPVSTTSRTILLFAAEADIPLEYQLVDLMTGEHTKEPYLAINPNGMVPVLEDGDFRLTESSAILKYLAEKSGSQAYPKDLQDRARVNEMMDWFNSNLYKDIAYAIVYPQVYPTHRRPSDAAQEGAITWGQAKTKGWLETLDRRLLGDKPYLCGKDITIADYFAAPIISLGDIVGSDFSAYPNVSRWLSSMKALPTWGKVNEAFYGLVAAVKGKPLAGF